MGRMQISHILKELAHTLNYRVTGPIFQTGAALVVCMDRTIDMTHTLLLRIPRCLTLRLLMSCIYIWSAYS